MKAVAVNLKIGLGPSRCMSGALRVQLHCFIHKGTDILCVLLIFSVDFSFLCLLLLYGAQEYQQ